jgi:hypothetical protein
LRLIFSDNHTAAQSWKTARRVVAKVEWHPGELYPSVGFVVTNLSRPAERVVAFYNQRGTAEQWIKEGKGTNIHPRTGHLGNSYLPAGGSIHDSERDNN